MDKAGWQAGIKQQQYTVFVPDRWLKLLGMFPAAACCVCADSSWTFWRVIGERERKLGLSVRV